MKVKTKPENHNSLQLQKEVRRETEPQKVEAGKAEQEAENRTAKLVEDKAAQVPEGKGKYVVAGGGEAWQERARLDMLVLAFEANDSGNAEKFLELYRLNLLYCLPTKTWYYFNGSYWVEDPDKQYVRQVADVFYHRLMRIFDLPDLEPWALKHKKEVLRLGNFKVREQMIKAAEVKSRCDFDTFNSQPNLMLAANTLVCLNDGQIRVPEVKDFLTQRTQVCYDNKAPEPLRFLKFLQEIFEGDEALISYTQKVLGYCLTGETREQCFFVFYGAGCNGKSVLLNLLRRMFPDFIKSLATSSFLEKRDYNAPNSSLVAAKDARLVLVNEVNGNARLDETLVKIVTGGDVLQVRAMYKAEIEIKPKFKVILTANKFPQVNWSDYALERRIRLIPFNRVFKGSEIDPHLPEKLWEERKGIFAWLVQGSVRWYQEGLGDQPPGVLQQLWKLRMGSESFCRFYEKCLEVTQAETDFIQASVLYQHYCSWCRQDACQDVLSAKSFGQKLLLNKIPKKMLGRSRCNHYLGLRLKQQEAANIS